MVYENGPIHRSSGVHMPVRGTWQPVNIGGMDFQPGVERIQDELVHAELEGVALCQIEHAKGDRLPGGKCVEVDAVFHRFPLHIAGADDP